MSELERVASTFLVVREAYVATLGIALVCGYLGLYCVLRRIVFTGVALAQLAAAGVAGSFFLGQHAPAPLGTLAKTYGATVGSLGMAVLGALGLQARSREGRLTSDAVVGLVYASATAIAMLLVVGSSLGQSELQNILAGEVLLTRAGDLSALWVGLVGVCAVHLLYRREFLLVSFDPEFARALGLAEGRLQLLLLGSLAIAVALSLKVGGLLLVFTFLVLPPVTGLTLGEDLADSTRLALGSALGASLLGFLLAICADLPVAPSIAVAILGLAGLARVARERPLARKAFVGLCAALSLGSLLVGAALFLVEDGTVPSEPRPSEPVATHHDHPDHDHSQEAPHLEEAIRDLAEGPVAARLAAIQHLAAARSAEAVEPLVQALMDDDHQVRDDAAAALVAISGQPRAMRALVDLLGDDDAECRACAAFAFTHLQDPSGVGALVESLAEDELPLLLKEQVLAHLVEITGGEDFGFDPFGSEETNRASLEAWRRWWADARTRLRWSAAEKRFRLD